MINIFYSDTHDAARWSDILLQVQSLTIRKKIRPY